MAEKSNLFATVICNIGNIGLFIFNLFYFYARHFTNEFGKFEPAAKANRIRLEELDERCP